MKNRLLRFLLLLAGSLSFICSSSAQTTRNININVNGTSPDFSGTAAGLGTGSVTVNPFGAASVSTSSSQNVDANFNPVGPVQATVNFWFNRLDGFKITATVPDPGNTTVVTFSGTISEGVGAFSGATGTATLTLNILSVNTSGLSTVVQETMSGSGSIKVGQTITSFSLANGSLRVELHPVATIPATGTGTMTPFGNVTMSASLSTIDGVTAQGTATFTVNATDSLTVFFVISNLSAASYSFTATVTASTGAFANSAGTATMTLTNTSKSTFTLTGSGTITQPATGNVTPIITSVKTAGSNASFIAPNDWVQIQGKNLVPANTPAAGMIWNNAPEFASGRMPTQLGTISAKVNNKPAYIYFFCSAATATPCGDNQTDQINILTPLDTTVGQVLVVVTNGNVSSAPFIVSMRPVSPSFLQWDLKGHPVATHTDAKFSLLGPTNLFPGFTTPAKKQETILVYGNGFGLPTVPLVEGSSSQSGVLPNPQPGCIFGTTPVSATVVLVTPGLYGFGFTVPNTAVSGDNPITCIYNVIGTPAGDVIAVE